MTTTRLARLPNARVVVIPDLGHLPGGLANMECYDRLITDFLAAGRADDLDVGCVATMAPPPFVLGAAGGGEPR